MSQHFHLTVPHASHSFARTCFSPLFPPASFFPPRAFVRLIYLIIITGFVCKCHKRGRASLGLMSKWILYKPARLTFSLSNAFDMCSTCVGRTCGICELGVRKTWTTQCQEGEEASNAEGKMKKDFRSRGERFPPNVWFAY